MNPEDASELKIEINNFLWKHLPDDTTIREAELIACKIFTAMTERK